MLYVLAVLAGMGLLFFAMTFICYLLTFTVPQKYKGDPHVLPDGDEYDALRQRANDLIDAALHLPCEQVWITAHDGVKLRGRMFTVREGAPVQILFHGYRSHAVRDLSGGLQLALESGCNALLVDQRAHGDSKGHSLAFGVLERFDALAWVEYVNATYGTDTPIILTGISMGAATVTMAAALPLPPNVVGIIADCGYTSPKAIICKVIKQLHLPAFIYHCIRLSGRIYGGFDVEDATSEQAVRQTDIPILFIHGENDNFVPCDMSRTLYAQCVSQKTLFTVPTAGHGLSYLYDTNGYTEAVQTFLQTVLPQLITPK